MILFLVGRTRLHTMVQSSCLHYIYVLSIFWWAKMTGYRLHAQCLISGKNRNCSLYCHVQTGIGTDPASYSVGNMSSYSIWCLQFITHLHLVKRIRKHWALSPLPHIFLRHVVRYWDKYNFLLLLKKLWYESTVNISSVFEWHEQYIILQYELSVCFVDVNLYTCM